MTKKGDSVIIIPCYNEEKRLSVSAFESFLIQNEHFNFIFVDDGSQDNTSNIIQTFSSNYPKRVQSIIKKQNEGKAEGIRTAFHQCIFKYDYIGYLDADLSTPVSELVRLREVLKEKSSLIAVFGSRVLLLGHDVKRKLLRFIFGRAFMSVMNMLLRFRVYDSQCGAKLFRKEIAEIALANQFLTSWIFDIEILCRIKKELGIDTVRNRIMEVPLKKWSEVGESKIKFAEFLKFPFELFLVWRKYQ